ncbi:hypothetical protein L6Y89_22425 (plasmid) [Enterobacter mori]|uniref:hypothetical protein n=1 Tax=Enterobacter mori TaxID=539813 RepID=UPI001EDBAA45|nr:hypothetical protein [Enterobacter mori]UKJ23746.1 hypothetical protein L6Y89_22425 [Enterobacter mori]
MISRIDRALCAATVVTLAMLIPVIIWSCATKNNDISNWIIALANVAMAVAAFAAYRKASQYLNEFFSKEGYTLATRMVNENLLELNMQNELLERASSFCAFYTGFNGFPPSASRLLVMQARINLFNKIRTRHHLILSNCETLSIQMLSYGIVASGSRKDALTNMLVALQNCLKSADELEIHVTNDFSRYKQYVENGINMSQPFTLTNVDNVTTQIRCMTENWAKMVASYEQFFRGKRHIQSLFCLNKETG